MNHFNLSINRLFELLRLSIAGFVVLTLMFASKQAIANIIQVNGNASPSSISVSSNGHSQVSWRVSQRSLTGGTATVSSANGSFFTIDGTLIGRETTLLQSSRLTQLRATTLFVLNESLDIPLSIIRSAQRSGSSQIIYQRTFVDSQDGSFQTASVNFQLNSGSIASELVISRIQMEFDDGRKMGIYGKNSEFNATAFISYKGTGLLEYSWEIATPSSTKGRPLYYPLISRKQYLLAGGQVTIQSPILPSQLQGDYLVRLKVNQIDARIELPIIRYVINTTVSKNLESRLATIVPSYPAANALLMASTEFKWKPVPNATAYQLEIHTKPIRNIGPLQLDEERPITGVLIPAAKTSLKIGEVSRSYLISGNAYYWRVIAINKTGQVIARSEFRKIRF